MSKAGISRQKFLDILAKHLPGNRGQRMAKARQLFEEIEEKISTGRWSFIRPGYLSEMSQSKLAD